MMTKPPSASFSDDNFFDSLRSPRKLNMMILCQKGKLQLPIINCETLSIRRQKEINKLHNIIFIRRNGAIIKERTFHVACEEINLIKDTDNIWNAFLKTRLNSIGRLKFRLKCDYKIGLPVKLANFNKHTLQARKRSNKHEISATKSCKWNNKDIYMKLSPKKVQKTNTTLI